MIRFPIEEVRASFPALSPANGASPPLIFDNPAGTQLPRRATKRESLPALLQLQILSHNCYLSRVLTLTQNTLTIHQFPDQQGLRHGQRQGAGTGAK